MLLLRLIIHVEGKRSMSDDSTWSDVLERKSRAASAVSDKVVPLHALDDESLLPDVGSDYKAAAVQNNGGLARLACVMGRKGFQPGGKAYRVFQYMHLDSDADFSFTKDGQEMTFRFVGLTPVEITVRGRNLLRIFDYIQLHRIAWIREADRDFVAGDETARNTPIITSIGIEDVTRKLKHAAGG
jgi:hypothetical protein